jgi:hypothetical protein
MIAASHVTNISVANNSSLQHVQIFQALLNIQNALPPQVTLQKPVMFLDALDRLAPIHLEWINSREAFLAVLTVRFKHVGLQMVQNGQFALQATRTKRDIDLNRPWETCFHPGQEYDMSMIFRDSSSRNDTACISCNYECTGETGQDITWQVQKAYDVLLAMLLTCSPAQTAIPPFDAYQKWLMTNPITLKKRLIL